MWIYFEHLLQDLPDKRLRCSKAQFSPWLLPHNARSTNDIGIGHTGDRQQDIYDKVEECSFVSLLQGSEGRRRGLNPSRGLSGRAPMCSSPQASSHLPQAQSSHFLLNPLLRSRVFTKVGNEKKVCLAPCEKGKTLPEHSQNFRSYQCFFRSNKFNRIKGSQKCREILSKSQKIKELI